MFDYDGFDPIEEDGLISKRSVDILRSRLEDLIDRLYVENEEIDNDEIDCDIREMANTLGVYVPYSRVEINTESTYDHIEYMISTKLYPAKRIYRAFSSDSAFSLLKDLRIEKNIDCISIVDIARFCFSPEFESRSEDIKNVL